jgi:hypothetical protein
VEASPRGGGERGRRHGDRDRARSRWWGLRERKEQWCG